MYGLKDHKRQTKSGKPYDSVDFPYWSPDGQTVMGLRFRKAAHKNGKQDFRFEWEEGSHLCLYGQWMTAHWEKKSVLLVEGESDTQTLVINGYQALGVPGAANYNADRDDPILDQFDVIYVYCEPDTGGKTMFTRFAGDDRRQPSKLLHKMRFWSLYREDVKDVCAAPTSIIMESRESTYGGVVAPVGRGCRPVFRRSARPFYNICVQINVL